MVEGRRHGGESQKGQERLDGGQCVIKKLEERVMLTH